MRSPITGREMVEHKEQRELVFRKETFSYTFHCYLCEDTGDKFTTTEQDTLNINQVYNQYREKHKLPFPEQIKAIRESYGLSASKMSEILGFGANVYRSYENGEVPNQSNSNLIKLISDANQFKVLVESSDVLDSKIKTKILAKVDDVIQQEEKKKIQFFDVEKYLLDGEYPNEFTGYKTPSLEKLTEMVVYFAELLQPWKTQLNKLLFYADFLSFKRTGFSISGINYRAIQMGPVPNNFNSIFDYMSNRNDVNVWLHDFTNGGIGEQFTSNHHKKFNSSIFNETELKVLDDVFKRFDLVIQKTAKEIIDISHEEKAWIDNHKEKRLISYKYAFELINVQ